MGQLEKANASLFGHRQSSCLQVLVWETVEEHVN